MNKRILFVDDEPMVLQGVQRSLRGMRAEWDIEVATSGLQALELMERSPFDVVVSDMRMPGMDGASLLEKVKTKFPRTVRFVLSGQSDRETILRSVGPTHQYLSKPCDVEELKQKLVHAFALRDLLEDPVLKEIVSRLESVPSLPTLYIAMTQALQSPNVTVAELGHIIAQDMGMSSKVLQLANSAFFGLCCEVSNPTQALSLIGIDNIRALVLSVHVFSELGAQLNQRLAFLWKHSFSTAAFAKIIAHSQGSNQAVVDQALSAGLLHDIGRLVLATACKEQYWEVLQKTADKQVSISVVEQETFGCSHAEVGAYLLGLWGLPVPIIEAVAWHHKPSQAALAGFSPVLAVHVADHTDQQMHHYFDENPTLDADLIAHLGLKDRLEVWFMECQNAELNHESSGLTDSGAAQNRVAK